MHFAIFLIFREAAAKCNPGFASNGDGACIRCGVFLAGACFKEATVSWWNSTDEYMCADTCHQRQCTQWSWTDTCNIGKRGCCWTSNKPVPVTNLLPTTGRAKCVSWFKCDVQHHRAEPGVRCSANVRLPSCTDCGKAHMCKEDCVVKDNICRNTVYAVGNHRPGMCSSSRPCNKCQGSCSTTEQCNGRLICFRPALDGIIPGCADIDRKLQPLSSSYCVEPCKEGEFFLKNGKCAACGSGCAKCDNPERCTECGAGYVRTPDASGKCRRDCMHYCANRGQCSLVENVPKCTCGADYTGDRCSVAVGNWTAWTECSVSCGGGTQQRNCTTKRPGTSIFTCDKSSMKSVEEKPCNTDACPVPTTVAPVIDGPVVADAADTIDGAVVPEGTLGPADEGDVIVTNTNDDSISGLNEDDRTTLIIVLIIAGVVLLCLAVMFLLRSTPESDRQDKSKLAKVTSSSSLSKVRVQPTSKRHGTSKSKPASSHKKSTPQRRVKSSRSTSTHTSSRIPKKQSKSSVRRR